MGFELSLRNLRTVFDRETDEQLAFQSLAVIDSYAPPHQPAHENE